jgi:hypothetical protein
MLVDFEASTIIYIWSGRSLSSIAFRIQSLTDGPTWALGGSTGSSHCGPLNCRGWHGVFWMSVGLNRKREDSSRNWGWWDRRLEKPQRRLVLVRDHKWLNPSLGRPWSHNVSPVGRSSRFEFLDNKQTNSSTSPGPTRFQFRFFNHKQVHNWYDP